jgi:hypothetical protein
MKKKRSTALKQFKRLRNRTNKTCAFDFEEARRILGEDRMTRDSSQASEEVRGAQNPNYSEEIGEIRDLYFASLAG